MISSKQDATSSNDFILLNYLDETEKYTGTKKGFTFMNQYDKPTRVSA